MIRWYVGEAQIRSGRRRGGRAAGGGGRVELELVAIGDKVRFEAAEQGGLSAQHGVEFVPLFFAISAGVVSATNAQRCGRCAQVAADRMITAVAGVGVAGGVVVSIVAVGWCVGRGGQGRARCG